MFQRQVGDKVQVEARLLNGFRGRRRAFEEGIKLVFADIA